LLLNSGTARAECITRGAYQFRTIGEDCRFNVIIRFAGGLIVDTQLIEDRRSEKEMAGRFPVS